MRWPCLSWIALHCLRARTHDCGSCFWDASCFAVHVCVLHPPTCSLPSYGGESVLCHMQCCCANHVQMTLRFALHIIWMQAGTLLFLPTRCLSCHCAHHPVVYHRHSVTACFAGPPLSVEGGDSTGAVALAGGAWISLL